MSGAVRPAVPADLPALTDLYNHYVRETVVTFDVAEQSLEERGAWFAQYAQTGRHRLLVVEDERAVRGYATSSRLRPKAAYDTSVETTIYLHHEVTGRGLGRLLYSALLAELATEDVHRAFAGVALPNDASVRLHESLGFRPVGTYGEVGRKFGRYWDVRWFERPVP